ncbi:hypothetical protein JTB14_006474 [Gonioctena quinquepunctata]|nr:hypothetical protein JTB14_006474 [Gonioctena quinquepunctata]
MSIPNENVEEMMTSHHEKITPEQVSNGLKQAMGEMVNKEFSTEDKWILVKNRNKHHKRRNKPIVGNISGCPLEAADQKAYLHVYKLDIDMKPKDVLNFLKKPFPEAEVEQLESKHHQCYSSFKVAIDGNNYERAMASICEPVFIPKDSIKQHNKSINNRISKTQISDYRLVDEALVILSTKRGLDKGKLHIFIRNGGRKGFPEFYKGWFDWERSFR